MSTTIVGVERLYYAKIIEETVTGTTYESPQQLGYVQEMTVAPQVEVANQYGDNRVIETASAMGGIEVEVTLTGIEPEVEADILGHQFRDGVTIKSSNDVAPNVALLYARLKADGTYRYKILYKGQFALPEESNATKEDAVEFQSTALTATFVPRVDGVYEFQIDEGSENAPSTDDFFNQVTEPVLPETPAPTF